MVLKSPAGQAEANIQRLTGLEIGQACMHREARGVRPQSRCSAIRSRINPISSVVMRRPWMTMPCAMVNTVEDHIVRVQRKIRTFFCCVRGGGGGGVL